MRRIAVASVIALVGLAGTTALGFWQYARAHRDDISRQVLAAPAVPIRSLVAPRAYVPESAFGHRVDLGTSKVVGAQALLSCGRTEHGQRGCWVIAPAYLTPRLAVTVVLGFTADAGVAVDSALTRIRRDGGGLGPWSGRLQPAEVIDKGRALLAPSETVTAINVNELAMRWDTQLLDGYVVLDGPQPNIDGLQPGLTSPLILPPSGITWRNLLYAWQWWAFAAFVLFLLWRYVRDVLEEAPSISSGTSVETEELP